MADTIQVTVELTPQGIEAAGREITQKLQNALDAGVVNARDAGRKIGDALSVGLESARKKLREVGESLSAIGAKASISITAPLTVLGVTAAQTAVKMDSLKRGLIAVAGSSAEAERQLVRLKEVAKLPGLGFEEAIQGSINLQAAGLSAAEAERTLKGFGNALATVGKGKAELDGVVLAISQIQSKGKISAEEINQIAERVPQIRQVLLDAFGTANSEILQQAGITSEEFIKTVNTSLEKLPQVTGGAQNALENFDDTRKRVFGQFGDALLRILIPILERVTPLLERLGNAFAALSPTAQTVIAGIAALVAAIGPLLVIFGTLASSISSIIALFGGGAAAAGGAAAGGGLLAAIGPVIAILAAVGLAAYGLYKAWQTNFLGIRDITKSVIDAVKNFFSGGWRDALKSAEDAVAGTVATLEGYWNSIPADVQNALSAVGGYFSKFFSQILEGATIAGREIGKLLIDGLNFAFDGLGDKLVAKVKSAYDSLKNFFGSTPLPQPSLPSQQQQSNIANSLQRYGVGTTFLNGLDLSVPSAGFTVGNTNAAAEIGRTVARSFVEEVQQSAGFKKWAEAIEAAGGEVFLRKVEDVAKAVGADPRDLLGVIAFESRFNPAIKNPKGSATGLIQFTEKTASNLGTTTAALSQQTAVQQLDFVQKYLEAFGKTLDTTEKIYSAVLAGRVLSDPNKVLFADKGSTKNTDPFFANRALDKDQSGTITLFEAAAQIRKQGFKDIATDAQRLQATLKDTIPIISDVKAGFDPITVSAHQIATQIQPVPVSLVEAAQATSQMASNTQKAVESTQQLGESTDKAAERAAKLAALMERAARNEIIENNKKLRQEIEAIGKNLDLKAESAQLEAIREIVQADEDAVLSQIKNRTKLADATVFHAERAKATVLDFLAQETKGVTELVSGLQITAIQTAFDAADRGIAKLTKGLGVFKDFVSQILSGLARMILNRAFQAIFGLNNGGGSAPVGGFGSFTTSGFAGGNPAQQLLSTLTGSGISTAPSISNIGGLPVFNGQFQLPPLVGPGGSGGGSQGLLGLLGGNFKNLFSGIGFGKGVGTGGALASALPLLGLSLGAGLGGSSTLGQILGGVGGLAVGVGLTAAPSALAGVSIGGLKLASLFSNPFTAIAGVGLLVGAFLLGRAKQRRKDESTSGDYLQQAIDAIRSIREEVKTDRLRGDDAKKVFESEVMATFIAQINTIKTKSVRESRLKNQTRDLRNLFETEVGPEIEAQKKRIQQGTFGTGRNILPEFNRGGIVPGIDFGFDSVMALLRPREVVLNLQQQAAVAALSGRPNIFALAGVPGANAAPTPTAQPVQAFNQGGFVQPFVAPIQNSSGTVEIVINNVELVVGEGDITKLFIRGAQTSDGRSVIIRSVKQARRLGDL